MRRDGCALTAAVLLLLLGAADSSFVSGKARSETGFAFLGKFGFDVFDGSGSACGSAAAAASDQRNEAATQVQIVLYVEESQDVPPRDLQLQIYLFDDEADSWPAVWVDHAAVGVSTAGSVDLAKCHERSAVFSTTSASARAGHLPCDGKINVTAGSMAPAGKQYTFIRTIHQNVRPRTWFVVLGTSDCQPFKDIHYEVTFQNPSSEFGVNEQGLNWLYGVFLLAYVVLVGIQFYSRSLQFSGRRYNQLPKLLTTVLVAELVSCLCFSVHFMTFTFDGEGFPLIAFFAENAQAFSKLVMVLLLVLLAQGWTIVRAEVQDRRLIVGLMLSLLLGTFVLLLWGEYPATSQEAEDRGFLSWFGRDAASTKYIYEESPGLLLLGMDLFAAAVFLTTIVRTIRSCDAVEQLDQSTFMWRIAAVFGVYLVAVPLFVAIFAHVLDPWAEEKWVRTIEMLCNFAANSAMLYLIWGKTLEGSNHFMQAGNFRKVSDNDVARRSGLGSSLLENGKLQGPDSALTIHGGF